MEFYTTRPYNQNQAYISYGMISSLESKITNLSNEETNAYIKNLNTCQNYPEKSMDT